MKPSDVTVLGTGALASLVGARLARGGCRVTMVGSWREAIEAIAARGLIVDDVRGRWTAPARAVHLGSALAPAALVLVLVKGSQTARVAAAAAALTRHEGLLLTLQNGLGHRERLAAAAEEERVGVGVAFLGATTIGPGAVRDGGGTRVVVERHPRVTVAAEALAAAGFSVEVADDIAPTVWLKLAANCAINPLSALLRVPNGRLIEDAAARATLAAVAREVGAVAAAQGIRLADDPAAAAEEVARLTAHNRSSMLQDVERGVATEIDVLNGAVVREAERLGLAVPENRRLLAAVHALEVEPGGAGRARSRVVG